MTASPAQPAPGTGRHWAYLALTIAAVVPWILLYYTGPRGSEGYLTASHVVVAAASGLAILGAAFLLSWAAEVAQLDMAQSLALVILSLIAILPEYAISMAFAWDAGKGLYLISHHASVSAYETGQLLEKSNYTVANMTGANRLLIGVAWSAVVFIYYWRTRRKEVTVEASRVVEIKYLLLATLYSFTLPLKAALFGIGLHWIDAVVLMALFGFYARATAGTAQVEPDLMGPPQTIAALPRRQRRFFCLALFVGSAWTIFLAAHPFADSLVRVGHSYGINEFLLVQWIAPLASEMPEFIVAGLFAWRRVPAMGMGALISSKVNQWTLLVGLLPIVFGLAARQAVPLPLDEQQTAEVLLTSAQSLFAVAVLLNLSVTVTEAAGLLFLFLTQAIAQLMIHITLTNTPIALALVQHSQYFFSVIYIVLALYTILISPERRAIIVGMLRGASADQLERAARGGRTTVD